MTTPTLSAAETAIRLIIAGGLGATIGIEREWRERSAGLRTHMLVALGAAMFTMVSAYGWADFYGGHTPPLDATRDTTRVAAQVVSGIGFLGGGAIIRSGFSVRGLTTAAGLWATAAIGMAVGAGMYQLALFATIALLFALVVLRSVGSLFHSRVHHGDASLQVTLGSTDLVERVLDEVERHVSEIESVTIEPSELDNSDRRLTINVELRRGNSKEDLARTLLPIHGLTSLHITTGQDQ